MQFQISKTQIRKHIQFPIQTNYSNKQTHTISQTCNFKYPNTQYTFQISKHTYNLKSIYKSKQRDTTKTTHKYT